MLAPRVLNVALRSVERHVVGERQGGVRRNVGGESLPVLVVNPIDARAARFPYPPPLTTWQKKRGPVSFLNNCLSKRHLQKFSLKA